MTLGENIRRLRKVKGLTQDELSDKLYYSSNAVSSWERNRTKPSVETLKLMAEVLGVSVGELTGDKKI